MVIYIKFNMSYLSYYKYGMDVSTYLENLVSLLIKNKCVGFMYNPRFCYLL